MDLAQRVTLSGLDLNTKTVSESRTHAARSKLSDYVASLDDVSVSACTAVKDLGVIIDPSLSFESHVNNITRIAFFHLRNIAKIRNMMSLQDAEKLVHAFVTSRLDYCNALLSGCARSWYCMRKSGVSEKYVRVVQDMYEDSVTAVKCAVGTTDWFKVKVGLHQGSAQSPFLFAVVMDRLTDEVRQESPRTMMFADDIVICGESSEQVEKSLERWRYMLEGRGMKVSRMILLVHSVSESESEMILLVNSRVNQEDCSLERRGMKVSRSKTWYMCVNKREGSGGVRLQGEEVEKVEEFRTMVQEQMDQGSKNVKTVKGFSSIALWVLQ
ncbi:hypothetical protein C0J45_14253 [Silurus meridionalis]|nr:hypothetical protein C0J45_14253 [Silurus meridionalis]